MKKILPLLCAALVLLGGCVSREESAPTPSPAPAATAEPTPAATEPPTPAPTPSPTAAPAPEQTSAPRWVKTNEEETYVLYIGSSAGAGALYNWLLWEGADEIVSYSPADQREPMFTLLFTPQKPAGEIPAAAEETKYLRLATDRRMAESGLLAKLLPAFEKQYGYSVEVVTGEAGDVNAWAGGAADVTLLTARDAAAMHVWGFAAVTNFVSTAYDLM